MVKDMFAFVGVLVVLIFIFSIPFIIVPLLPVSCGGYGPDCVDVAETCE